MRYLTLCLFLSLAGTAHAEERELIFGGEMSHGGFGGPMLRATSIVDSSQMMAGGYGAYLMNHRFYVGGGGYGTVSDIGGTYSSFSYGGVLVGMFIQPQRPIHWLTDISINSGNISMKSNDGSMMHDEGSDNFIVIEPSVGLSINLAEPVKLNFSVSYRIVSGVDLNDLSDSDLSGFSLNGSMIFGKF